MNGLEKITGRIQSDAQAEADAILTEARKEAEGVAADFARRTEAASRDILERGKVQAAQREERMESMADLEGRKLVLGEKQKVLAAAYDRALEKLKGLDKDGYIKLLTDLLVKASVSHKEAVILNQADRAQVGKEIVTAANAAIPGGSLTLSPETREMTGGFVLADGPVEVNCSLETLLEEQKERLTGEVHAILFPQ